MMISDQVVQNGSESRSLVESDRDAHDFQEFFAPVSSDLIDSLIAQYRDARKNIAKTVAIFAGDMGNVVHYFVAGNADKHSTVSAGRLFQEDGAIKALNSSYWSKALAFTDVLDVMPQARRSAWHEQIEKMTTPEFTEDTVRPTIDGLLASRAQFLAERVDGIFRALSGEHVTNSPMGFGKRMIIGYMLSYGSVSYERAGYINDLRCVIAKFMGRDEPKHYVSRSVLEQLQCQWGQWVTFDGGALRIRLYRKGTAHLEVHPDMAWRLNQILAHLHPRAIPSEFRTKPARRAKNIPLILRPLPFAVLAILDRRLPMPRTTTVDMVYQTEDEGKAAWDEACRVLAGIGGVAQPKGRYVFDYSPREVIRSILASGCIPDKVSHQYYATPENIARDAIALAEIGPDHSCLEPSAGQGCLADFMPKDTLCIDVSAMHCQILQAKGHDVRTADFLQWNLFKFDRIVMNPPFSEGRWQAHVQHAATLLSPGGRLVAVLPTSAKSKSEALLPVFHIQWSKQYDNEFSGTSISVVIMIAAMK